MQADAGLVEEVQNALLVPFEGLESAREEMQGVLAGADDGGILSGFLCGLYGVGALLGAYIGRVTEDSKAFKANICLVFVIENSFRIILYSLYGIITLEALKTALFLAPCMLAGLGAGMLSARVIDEKYVKKIVIIMLIISGIALILTNAA